MSLFDLIGAGLHLAGGVISANASKKAAKTQAVAYEQAAEKEDEQFRPYGELGDHAAGILQRELASNALLEPYAPVSDVEFRDPTLDPGYRFRLSEGEKSIDRNAGARGKRYSGQTLKALQRFGQDYASNEYGKAYGRSLDDYNREYGRGIDQYNRDSAERTQRYNFLTGAINQGRAATGSAPQFISSAGDARAAGQVGASNALLGGVADAYSGWNQARYLEELRKRPQVRYVA